MYCVLLFAPQTGAVVNVGSAVEEVPVGLDAVIGEGVVLVAELNGMLEGVVEEDGLLKVAGVNDDVVEVPEVVLGVLDVVGVEIAVLEDDEEVGEVLGVIAPPELVLGDVLLHPL